MTPMDRSCVSIGDFLSGSVTNGQTQGQWDFTYASTFAKIVERGDADGRMRSRTVHRCTNHTMILYAFLAV